ncbi:hypothetical protein ZWY2020_034983 [Hordeum vulgare]|nr:hypothetical protein ZWY2020_034983 [Hordeum vulgare]
MQCKFVTHVTLADDVDQAEEEQGTSGDQAAEEENADQAVAEATVDQAAEEANADDEEYVEEQVEEDSEGEVSDEETGSEQGSDYVDEIVDSDYDVTDLDDDLKEDTVEERADVHIRTKPGPVQGSDEEELELPDSDDEAGAMLLHKRKRKILGPLPESSFLKEARGVMPSVGNITTTRLGNLVARVEVMREAKQQSNEILHEKRCAEILEQREVVALQKEVESLAKKQFEKAKKAHEKEALKVEAIKKREQELEAKKLETSDKKEALLEARKRAAEDKKTGVEAKKIAAL